MGLISGKITFLTLMGGRITDKIGVRNICLFITDTINGAKLATPRKRELN